MTSIWSRMIFINPEFNIETKLIRLTPKDSRMSFELFDLEKNLKVQVCQGSFLELVNSLDELFHPKAEPCLDCEFLNKMGVHL